MLFVDSHCHLDHLDLTAYDGSLDRVLAQARLQGVNHFLCVGLTPNKFSNILTIANQHTDVSASIGVHPDEILAQEPTIEMLLPFALHPKVVAIGETGLDYYRDTVAPAVQQSRFRLHIQLAREVNKPLIVHTRMAKADTLRILQEEKALGGVLHCFTEDEDMAKAAIDLGFYISFSGIITFANAKILQETAIKIPLEHLLIETDSPYLAPVPHRGKANEPAYVRLVAEKLATLKQIALAEVAKITTHNFFQLFKLALPQC